MEIQEIFALLTPEQRDFQLGINGADPLTKGFPRKRVLHAGLPGKMLSLTEGQQTWERLMAVPPVRRAEQSVYIHIPFCKTKCLYCGFFQNGIDQVVEDRYVDYLLEELQREEKSPRLQQGLVHTVFIGGGTPTSLSARNAERLLKAIQQCIPLANDYELTLEGRVHDLLPEKMDVWLSGGVNRMSLGVQSFNTKVRRQLGRLDDKETVLQRLRSLLDYHQCVVVIDLIYGLPDQDMAVWQEDLKALEASGVDGADLYQLNVFDGSALNQAIKDKKIARAATTAQQAKMFAYGYDFLTKRAYKRLSNCHWSRNNRERSLYNSMAKAGVTMFPFGCGAGGSLDGYAIMNHRFLKAYEACVGKGQKPLMVMMQESPLESIARSVIDQMERGVLNLNLLASRDERLKELRWLYDLWEERGLVHNNGVLFELTVPGQFWQINLTQTTLECMQSLLTGKNTLAVQHIAAQEERHDS
ncbi:heme anaerobic degradation radical SAM methyltransferase ChuW/HutW [Pectinatus cerevisiiphilus]|uniref:Oxygen-independent coproporphyrinogen-3 oxidase n=1 Tax=Pectinatus cerevisiiphilus TaxID=86956 RepID=A0A4R3K9K1_9FIRM|nr:heme anaerobic degradation radical SAM methyltransferase ChuW/HutW [Pectinatus cerevisiiphilus]TCS79608.1 oxygen-independent coproporphyrinogen-3 oxidase [Pectinatus cerevisiiphilus]